MRAAPSPDQLLADSLNWSEQLRAKAIAGCDDVMEMVSKMCQMPAFIDGKKGNIQATVALKVCKEWGLRWQGKNIEKQTWLAIQSIMPFCQDDAILSAIGDIKTLYADIDKLTTLSKLCKVASSFHKGSFLIDEFQEKPPSAIALQWAFTWFYHYLQFGDCERGQVSNNFLVGRVQAEVGTVQVFFRKLQVLDFLWRHYRTSLAFDPEVGQRLWDKFSSMTVFVSWATASDFWKREANTAFPNGQKGAIYWTMGNFIKFCETLPSQAAVAFAELLHGMMTTQFDIQCMDHVTEQPDGGHADYDSLVNMMRGVGVPDKAGENPLTMAFKKYTKALAGQATTIKEEEEGEAGSSQPLAAFLLKPSELGGDDADSDQAAQQQEKKQLLDKIMACKGDKVRFHALPHLPAGPLANFMNIVEMNKIMAACPFHASMKPGLNEKVKSKAFLLSSDLFPGCMAGGAKDYKLQQKHFQDMEVPEALKALWNWVLSVRQPDDSIVVFDGRFPQVRRFFDAEMGKLNQTFLLDLWIIYGTPLAEDIRYPKRHKAFSNPNREVMLVYRPVPKKKNTCQARLGYNICGEQSTFDMTYSGVQLRSLGELPKLTTQDKKKMMGSELDVPLSYPGDEEFPAGDGVPFAWGETKSVDWWATFLKDMGIDHVFDTTVGSTAAAIGAFYSNIQYDGLCCNPLHKAWCEQLMNQAMLAVVADGGAGATADWKSKVVHFFGPAVDEGMRMLKAAEQKAAKTNTKPADEPEPEDPEDSDDD
jgi:hypothetical protein